MNGFTRLCQKQFRPLFLIIVFGVLAGILWVTHRDYTARLSPQHDLPVEEAKHPEASSSVSCRGMAGADEVLVVLKTGSTELIHKLPVHFNTTFQCYSDYLIFSDYEEVYDGEHILDALQDVSEDIKASHPDFDLYRRLQRGGRSVLKLTELSGFYTTSQRGVGKVSNSGWQLDRWKFLPMLNRTLHERPNKRWYVFIETDTSMFWSTQLGYISALDWNLAFYLGAQVWMGDIIFAHGGSGFMMSRPALEKIVSKFNLEKEKWEKATNDTFAGDIVLGKAMGEAGAPLLFAWPIWQGDDIGNMNWNEINRGRRLWCHPTISYHHQTPDTVESMWRFEQDWISTHSKVRTPTYDCSWRLTLTRLNRATSSDTKTFI